MGVELGLPEEMVWRQPFPGPGLAIRIIGEVTAGELEILQRADWIVWTRSRRPSSTASSGRSFAVLTDIRSVGVMGDFRTYGYSSRSGPSPATTP